MADESTPAETAARGRSDDAVGTPGPPPVAGGRRTPEQAAVTDLDAGGRTDADRHRETGRTRGEPGRNPAPFGGSSGGHSDRKSADAGDGSAARKP